MNAPPLTAGKLKRRQARLDFLIQAALDYDACRGAAPGALTELIEAACAYAQAHRVAATPTPAGGKRKKE
jgi:hypothetical protein